MQISAHKSANKATFALSDFVLLLVWHIGRLVLNKNAKKPFIAIFFGFREKIVSLTGLHATTLNNSRARAYCACSRSGDGLEIFPLICLFSSLSPSLGDGPI